MLSLHNVFQKSSSWERLRVKWQMKETVRVRLRLETSFRHHPCTQTFRSAARENLRTHKSCRITRKKTTKMCSFYVASHLVPSLRRSTSNGRREKKSSHRHNRKYIFWFQCLAHSHKSVLCVSTLHTDECHGAFSGLSVWCKAFSLSNIHVTDAEGANPVDGCGGCCRLPSPRVRHQSWQSR